VAVDHSQLSAISQLVAAGPAAMLFLGGRALTERGLRAASRIGAATGARLLAETFPARMERGAGLPSVDRLAYLAEMAEAFRVFRPLRRERKVTIFGSARTEPDHPAYFQARDLATNLAAAGWMVVTGAGPGIMAAGMEGAGRDLSIGVNIRLPLEQEANPFIAQDPKLVEMRYFFTRKLMLVKESDGYVVLPGGFGTLDEGFELLTLLQTGRSEPAPVVMLFRNSSSATRPPIKMARRVSRYSRR